MNGRSLRTVPREENIEEAVKKLGGDDILRRRYPELYKAVLNTRERVRNAPSRMPDESGDRIYGTEDSCKIRTLNYTPDTTLSSVSDMEMTTVKTTLAIVGDVVYADSGKVIDQFSVYDNNVKTLSGNCTADSAELEHKASEEFIAHSSFYVIEKDDNGGNIIKSLSSVIDSHKTIDNEPIVNHIDVFDPMPVKHKGADHTVVFYNRKSHSGWDYDYENVTYSKKDINVYMPFSGSVELNGTTPDPSNPVVLDDEEKGIVLQIENMLNGTAAFKAEYLRNVEWNVTGSVLTWKFPDDWHTVLRKNNLNCANNMDLYCRMWINTTSGFQVPIIIQSKGGEHPDPSYKKIPYINIKWGCFAKDVLIKMEDGTSLPVERIKIGDKVMTKGGVRTVTDVVTGREDQLIHIKSSSMNRINVSLDHPVLTTEGLLPADKLTAGTILITEDGEESIESLYLVDYNDTVYNLKLDSGGILIANNFYAGDFDAQNTVNTPVIPVDTAPPKLEEIQEEFADIISGINR